MPLEPHEIEEIRELVAQGLSCHAIAEQTGRARETVWKIANDQTALAAGLVKRCPTCGGKVVMPCRTCQTRESKVRTRTGQ